MYLSKSKYCKAVQCPKMLWLHKNMPDEFDESVLNQTVLETGSSVGDLAMGIFGDYTEVPYGKPAEMIAETERLMKVGIPVIAEASFSYNGLFCSVDILVNKGNSKVELYEVKSSTSVSEIYYHDVAYQYYVLKNCGLDVVKASVVHINNKYVRHGELDLNELFTIVDVTERICTMYDGVAERISFLEEYMRNDTEPVCNISTDCFDPYDCGFWRYCTRNLPSPNVFDLGVMQKRSKFKKYYEGIVSFEELEREGKIKDSFMIQVRHALHDLPNEIDKDAIRAFVQTVSYPLYFLDFESFQPAVPVYDYSRPYQQIVFQYSLHYMDAKDSDLQHKQFLAYPGNDPRRALAEQLCNDIPADVCVMAYNMGFEKGRIKELAELYPDLSEHLMSIHENIVDLMVPFQQKSYYKREMKGSYSIKFVLPALFPDDPSLDYHNLEGVHNGQEASDTFKRMASMEPDELEQYREHLFKYCGLDTYAMVKVWEKLLECIE